MKKLFIHALFRRGPASRPLRAAALVLIGLLMMTLLAPTASAAASFVRIENQNMEGTLKLLPGDVFAVGSVFRVKRPHPVVQVRIIAPTLKVKYRCEGDATNSVKAFFITAPVGYEYNRTISADDEQWAPTKDTNLADGFQFKTVMPDLCQSYPTRVMIVDGGAKGVDFSAYVGYVAPTTPGTTLPAMTLEIKFHYRVPRAEGKPNIDCSNPAQNPPPGISACSAKWSANRSLQPGVISDTADGQIYSNINGAVFVDTNGDGAQNTGEAGMPGVLIEVVDVNSGAVVNSQLTWNYPTSVQYNGRYALTVPVPGNYTVRQPVQPVGYTSTTANQATLAVPDGAGVSYDFGEQPTP